MARATHREYRRLAERFSTEPGFVISLLRRGKPLRSLPVPLRYLLACGIVLICFAIRYGLGTAYPYPYLIFILGIVLTSLLLDRGSGFLATGLSAILATYFFIEPRGSFRLGDFGPVLSVFLFIVVGLITATIIEILRNTVEELTAVTEDLHASRLDLSQNLALLETIMESTPDPIFIKNRHGDFLRVNLAAGRMLGVTPSGMVGRKMSDFLPKEEEERLAAADRKVLDWRGPLTVEECLTTAEAGERWFMTTKAPWFARDGSPAGIVEIARDIHERKLAEKEMQSANEQKSILLHDINHRIKNHMQTMISGLRLSLRDVHDESASQSIRSAITRLSVLARVYDRLELKRGGQALVASDDFLESLCRDLEPVLLHGKPVLLNLRIDRIPLPLGTAVSVGLIVNECITNAAKYAFPGDNGGTIHVCLTREEGNIHLEVADDGVGFSSETVRRGLGQRLIESIAEQLGGTSEWEGSKGARLVVRFPEGQTD